MVCHIDDWFIIHACKEPYHRNLLGYKGRGAPKEHPEYYFAERNNRLYLNLIDAADPKYIPEIIIDKALHTINSKTADDVTILVHCNQGESRSPVIGILYLNAIGFFKDKDFNDSEREFREIYSYYNPANGVRTFAKIHWERYRNIFKK